MLTTETAVIRFDPNYKISCPPPGTGTPDFEQADAEAAAFFAVWLANFDTKTLKYIGKKLSPLALQIVRWGRDELAAAMIDNDHSDVTRKMTELPASKPTDLHQRPWFLVHEHEAEA